MDEPPFDALVLFVLAGEVLSLDKGLDLIQAEGAGFGFVLGDFFWFGLDRRVDGIVPEIQEEGPLVSIVYQVEHLVGQVVG